LKDNVGGVGSVLRIGIDHFSSNLRSVKVKGVFPYEGIEYMGWRFNDNLGGGGEGKVNYWLIKGLGGGGEVRVYEVSEGGELKVEIPEDTTKINLGLVRDGVNKRLGSIFTNMVKEELVSFLAGRGLELVGFVEGVWEKSVNGDWVRPSVKDGIRYFVPLLDNEGYIISDWRGVPRAVYDEAGREIWRGEFGPFGEPLYERGVSNYIPFRLYGMYKDMETGLYYNVRRYYDWRVGRYLQPDPVSDLNLYVYVSNSPYDLVDPLGMFQTTMRVNEAIGWHEGHAVHEAITEEAIGSAFWCGEFPGRNICQHRNRWDNWDNGPWACFDKMRVGGEIIKVNYCPLQCRSYANTVAQGASRADCFYPLDDSIHCDNNNFDGCYSHGLKVEKPRSYGLINCRCTNIEPIITPIISPINSIVKNIIDSILGGCSVTPRLKKKQLEACECSFGTFSYGSQQEPMDFEKLGRFLHPVQDFWAHSTAIYVPGCNNLVCTKWFISEDLFCLEYSCAEYEREINWTVEYVPPGFLAKDSNLKSGLFDKYEWTAWDDFFNCSGLICDVHCRLNKDAWEFDRSKTHPCWGNIQRDAFWEVREKAVETTKNYLKKFCFESSNLCY
jgi:RHS repeat-associated protein